MGNEIVFSALNLRRDVMEKDPIDEHAAREAQPAEAERNYGILAAGVIALMCVGTAIYWVS
jgi:hypothetical protein